MPGARVDNLSSRMAACGLTVAQMARLAKVSDRVVHQARIGATCEPSEAAKMEAVLEAHTPAVTPVQPESGSRSDGETGHDG